MTDMDLDARVSAVEENSGGKSQNGQSFRITTKFASLSHICS